jgi:hypothetical protein
MRRLLQKNRRSSGRHAVHIPCQVVRERDFRLVADRIVNLSQSGMVVTPADPVVTGERVIASFRLPRSGAWIDVEATVSRVAHGRRSGEHTRSFAIEFDELSLRSQKMLEHTLRKAPVSAPCARPGRRSSKAALRRLVQSQSSPASWGVVFSGASWAPPSA